MTEPYAGLEKYLGEDKLKGTYYLSYDTMDRLEAIVPTIRRKITQTEPGKRGQINKSLIVEAALQIVFNDYDENGENSHLADLLSNL